MAVLGGFRLVAVIVVDYLEMALNGVKAALKWRSTGLKRALKWRHGLPSVRRREPGRDLDWWDGEVY